MTIKHMEKYGKYMEKIYGTILPNGNFMGNKWKLWRFSGKVWKTMGNIWCGNTYCIDWWYTVIQLESV